MIHRALMCVERMLAEMNGTPFEALEGRTLMSADPSGGLVDLSDQPRLGRVAEVAGERGMGLFGHGARAAVGLTLPVMTSGTGSASSVTVKWSGVDPTASSVTVQRSPDGKTWTSFSVSKTAVGYVDKTVTPGTTYFYRVMVKGPSSAIASRTIQVKAAIATPTATASVAAGKAVVTWTDTNPATVGYRVFRSTNGTTFTLAKEIAGGAAKTYSESLGAGSAVYFRVLAVHQTKSSSAYGTASVKAPAAAVSTATVGWRYGTELVVTSPASDTISVSQSSGKLLVTIGGVTTSYTMPSGLFIHDRGGLDSITIASSVTVRTTITALSGAATKVSSSASNVGVWLDTGDSFTGTASVHYVSSFAGGVSKATGASLVNPIDSGTTFKASGSLWGASPTADDVNQGAIGDCYFLASLAAFAGEQPAVLRETAVDLGDGTYVVQFMKSGVATYVRVNNQMPSGPWDGYMYAHPGDSGAIWGAVMEKAYAYFRTGANTYKSLNAGWMEDSYRTLGFKATSFSVFMNESSFYSLMSGDLAAGRAVTLATELTSKMLVGGHAYTLVSAAMEGGKTTYTVRNPWGVSGTSYESGSGYATLTFDQIKGNFYAGVRAA